MRAVSWSRPLLTLFNKIVLGQSTLAFRKDLKVEDTILKDEHLPLESLQVS